MPGNQVALATAAPLLLAGLGSGLVIAPNQTITLSEVPPECGGIAAVGAVFFASLAGMRGGQGGGQAGWTTAFRHGLIVVIVFVPAALGAAIVDLVTGRRMVRRI